MQSIMRATAASKHCTGAVTYLEQLWAHIIAAALPARNLCSGTLRFLGKLRDLCETQNLTTGVSFCAESDVGAENVKVPHLIKLIRTNRKKDP